MLYKHISELPKGVKHVLPGHAQVIYKEAYNNAYEEYKDPDNRRDDIDREETAHRVAWAAVKRGYEKGDDGAWHRVDEGAA